MPAKRLGQERLKNKEPLGMTFLHEWLGLPVGATPAAAEGVAAHLHPSGESLVTPAVAAARPALAGLAARPTTLADQAFLRELYATTRADEMRAVGWPAPRARSFLDQQFDFQQRRQRELHPDAAFLLLLARQQPVGTLAWRPGGRGSPAAPATLVDLALMPSARGRGIGTALLALLGSAADAAGWPIELQIDRNGRALGLLQRHGFVAEGDDSLNLRLRRPPAAAGVR